MAKATKLSTRRRAYWVLFWLGLLAVILGGADYIYDQTYIGRTFPGVQLEPLATSSITASQLRDSLQDKVDAFNQTGITFQTNQRTFNILPVVGGADGNSDVSYSWMETDVDKSVTIALNYGRTGNWLKQRQQRLTALLANAVIPLTQTIHKSQLQRALEQNVGRDLVGVQPVMVTVDHDGAITLTESKPGQLWQYDPAIRVAMDMAVKLASGNVPLSSRYVEPDIQRQDVPQRLINKAQTLLASAPLNFTYRDQTWSATATTVASWLRFTKTNSAVQLSVDEQVVKDFIENTLTSAIDRPATAIKFTITNGRVNEFQPSQEGQQLDATATLDDIKQQIKNGILTTSILAVRTEPAPPSGDTSQISSINELVAVGTSNFKGSPVNRRHNIAVGATAVNGILIQPGEEFSLLKTLGAIDATTGYKPELVIKGGKTLPEFGGGLCQIGTTAFRAALAAGTPITERRNHSYRVPYYEPAGTDATIYNPAPDFKFKNDYATPLLFQTRIVGDDLYFELWGAKDGRTATQTKPIISNLKKPASVKIIETLDLKPGEKKCTEKAHTGADAVFTYAVTYPSGQTVTEDFKSHYVPWQEVCLLGVTQLSASSTEPEMPVNP